MTLISASILSADFMRLADDLHDMEAHCDAFHLDVMDGHYVPNITFGPDIVRQIRRSTNKFLDTHLMIEHPEEYLTAFLDAGTDALTLHLETSNDVADLLHRIKARGVMPGISLNPETDLNLLKPFLSRVELILVMSVRPGFGGQSYMPGSSERIAQLAAWREEHSYNYKISVDGGIQAKTAREATKAGADILVSGSYLFGASDRSQAANSLRG